MSEQEPRELPEPGPPAAPQGRVLAAVAAGGALGALARYGALLLWPGTGGFPWTVFAVNVSGCALIGVLMVLTVERGRVTYPWCGPSSASACSAASRPSRRTRPASRTCSCVRRP